MDTFLPSEYSATIIMVPNHPFTKLTNQTQVDLPHRRLSLSTSFPCHLDVANLRLDRRSYELGFQSRSLHQLNSQVLYHGVYNWECKTNALANVIKRVGGLLCDKYFYGARLFRTFGNQGMIIIQL